MAQIYSFKTDFSQKSPPPLSLHLPKVKTAKLLSLLKEAALPLFLGSLGILTTTLWLEVFEPFHPDLKREVAENTLPSFKNTSPFTLRPLFDPISLIEPVKKLSSLSTPLNEQETPSFKVRVEDAPSASSNAPSPSQGNSIESDRILATFNLAVALDHETHLNEAVRAYEETLETLKKEPTALPLETQHQLIQRYTYLKETLKEEISF